MTLLLILITGLAFGFNITEKGKATANIVLSPQANDAERYACDEFIKYIKEMSGAELAVIDKPREGNNIFIGQTIAKDIVDFDFSTLKADGIYIYCKDNKLVLAGEGLSGNIYAVYHFLDEYLGVKYLTPTDDYIPKNPSISVKDINYSYAPPFYSRESFYHAFWYSPEFCLKTGNNGHYNYVNEKYGGHHIIVNFCHNIVFILSPDKYGKEHPEWYALWGGQRTLHPLYFQLCLSNKEMVQELTKNTLELFEQNPDADIVDLSIADCGIYCTCPECTKLTEKYGQSGALLTVINAVADEVKIKYPDKFVETIAYAHVTKAPKGGIVPRDNVIIRLCNIASDFSKPLDAPQNASYLEDIKDWKKISKQLFYWSYIIEFGNNVLPYPTFELINKNHKILRDNGVVGVFDEGDDGNPAAAGLERYKMYIDMKSLWNPDLDFDKESKAFMDAYYGPAGGDMFDFMKLSCKVFEKYPHQVRFDAQDNSWWSAKDYIKAFRILKSAYNKTKDLSDTKYADRVKYDALSFQAGLVIAKSDIIKEVEKSNVLVYSNEEALKLIREFLPKNGMEKAIQNSVYIYEPKPKCPNKPKEVENLPDDMWVEQQAVDFMRAVPDDNVCKVVDDPKASDGKAMWMTSDSIDWYVQPRYNFLYLNNHYKYADIYVTYRVEMGNEAACAYGCCLYTAENPKTMFMNINSDETPDGEYKTVKLGTLDFNKDSCNGEIYFCGVGGKGIAKGLYVDRIFYVYHN